MQANLRWELQKRFEEAIVKGEYSTGQITTDYDLAAHFRVHPEAMRQVLLAEHRKGLVRPHNPGFQILGIIEPRFDSLFQHTSKSGLGPSSQVRCLRLESASQAAAEKLDVAIGAPVYRLDRTRNVNSEVVANQINYIPYEVCPGLEHDDVSHYSFQGLLEAKYHAIVSELEEELRLEAANDEDQEILSLSAGASVLVIHRLSLSATHCPLVWANIHIRVDRYQYVSKLWPQAASLLSDHNAK